MKNLKKIMVLKCCVSMFVFFMVCTAEASIKKFKNSHGDIVLVEAERAVFGTASASWKLSAWASAKKKAKANVEGTLEEFCADYGLEVSSQKHIESDSSTYHNFARNPDEEPYSSVYTITYAVTCQ